MTAPFSALCVQMRWDYTGMVGATDPFGGSYDVLPPVWAIAHTTQFTAPGWRLLSVGSGSGWLRRGGTYVTYVGPSTSQLPGGDLTIVIEKMDASESKCERGQRPGDKIAITEVENATFVVSGFYGVVLPHTMTVWASHFGGGDPTHGLFTQLPDTPVVGGTVTISVLPNWAYTLSTVRTATKGGKATGTLRSEAEAPPLPGRFPTAYFDTFDQCALSSIPKYLAPLAGAFECLAAGGGRSGRAVRQASPAKAICDRGDVRPYAIIGDGFRTMYNVSIDVLLPATAAAAPPLGKAVAGEHGAFVGARTKGPVGSGTGMDGVFFAVNATGWHVALQVSAIGGSCAGVLASGVLPVSAMAGTWRRLSLNVSGAVATAFIDDSIVVSALKIPVPYDHHTAKVTGEVVSLGKGGYASFGTIGYTDVQFDALSVDSSD